MNPMEESNTEETKQPKQESQVREALFDTLPDTTPGKEETDGSSDGMEIQQDALDGVLNITI